MTKGTKQKSSPKKKSETKTKWDDLDIETLKSKIESLEQDKEQAIHERIKVQTEHDAVLKYYNIASERRKQLQEQLQLERFQQDDILSEHNAEVQVYLDKMESLQYDFDCKLDFIEQELNMSFEKEAGNHQSQIQSNEMVVSNLKQKLTKRKIENMQEIRLIKAQYEEEINMLRNTLSAELDALEESCSSRQQELEEKVDLKRMSDLSKSVEQLNIHLAELAKKHQELSDSTQAYWEEKFNKNKAQVAKLKEDSHKLDKVLSDNETMIETLEKETAELTEPLSALTLKVSFSLFRK
jgi:Fe-S cluster assembly iron-binding protein IscA